MTQLRAVFSSGINPVQLTRIDRIRANLGARGENQNRTSLPPAIRRCRAARSRRIEHLRLSQRAGAPRTEPAELTGTIWSVTSQIEQVADRGEPPSTRPFSPSRRVCGLRICAAKNSIQFKEAKPGARAAGLPD